MDQPKFYFVLRFDKDGNELGTIDIPERDLEETLKRNPSWKVVGETSSFVAPTLAPVEPEVTKSGNPQCPLCGKEFANEKGLKLHKSKAHK